MSLCTNCGNPLPAEARFCPVCGTPAPESPVVESPAPEETPSPEDVPVQEEAPAAENAHREEDVSSSPAESGAGWYQSADQQTASATAPVYSRVKPAIGSIFDFYRKAFAVLAQKPVKLWGLSLLYVVIAGLISSLGALVPLVSLPIILLLSLGFTGILLAGYHGREVRSVELFSGFKKEDILRNGAGMCWKELWTLIWGFVPVMNIIKIYSYSFVPYILLTDKEITATEALKKSMRMTDGYKGKMFLADLVLVLGFCLAFFVLVILARIPFIGFLFGIALVLLYLAVILFFPLLLGLVRTAFFEEISAVHEE